MFRVGEDVVRHAALAAVEELVEEVVITDADRGGVHLTAGQELPEVGLLQAQTVLGQHLQELTD